MSGYDTELTVSLFDYCFTLASTLADIIFYKFLELYSVLSEKNIFITSFLFLTDMQFFVDNPLESKIPYFLLNKSINFIKNWKISHKLEVMKWWTLCFSSYKNHKSKEKLWWVGAHERKKECIFVTFILSEGNFFIIFIFCQYIIFSIVYWNYFKNKYTFTLYQKTLIRKTRDFWSTLFLVILACKQDYFRNAVTWSYTGFKAYFTFLFLCRSNSR